MKIKKKYQRGFTTVDNTVLDDERISWKAKGLFVYLWRQPDDWNYYEKEVVKHSTDGRDGVKAGIKELEKFGYLSRERNRRPNGTLSTSNWILSEIPMLENPTLDEPITDFPTLEKPTLENPQLLNTNLTNTNLTKTTTTNLYKSRVKNQDMIQYLNSVDDELVEWITSETEKAPQPSQRYFESIVKRLMSINAMTVQDATKTESTAIPEIDLIKLGY